MKENGINQMQAFEAKIEHNTGYFFCRHFLEVGEVGQGCGKRCKQYKPRNGKNGRCINSANVYEHTDKSIIINLKTHKKHV